MKQLGLIKIDAGPRFCVGEAQKRCRFLFYKNPGLAPYCGFMQQNEKDGDPLLEDGQLPLRNEVCLGLFHDADYWFDKVAE